METETHKSEDELVILTISFVTHLDEIISGYSKDVLWLDWIVLLLNDVLV